jgi:multidrug transporter EmrE-like cation transporter
VVYNRQFAIFFMGVTFTMSILIRVLPIALLVAYSQLVIKYRVNNPDMQLALTHHGFYKYIAYVLDPYVMSAYIAGLAGSLIWLFTVARLPLAQAFPIYQGLTFLLVVLGSATLLDEPLNFAKLLGAALILAGVTIGSQG